MPSFDVEIFNVQSTGSDTQAQLAGASSPAVTSAVSANQPSNPVDVSVTGAGATASAGVLLSGSRFIMSRNTFGGMPTSAISRLHTETDSMFLWARCAHFIGFQPQFMWVPSERAGWVTDWQSINNTNPLALCAVHQAPLHNTPGFRTKARDKFHAITNFAQSASASIDRKDVALSLSATNELLHTNSQASTTNIMKQAGWHVNINNAAVQDYMAKILVDGIAGTDLTGLGFGGGDVSDFMGWMHDGSDVVSAKSGAALRNVRSTNGTGFINTIVSANHNQPIIVRLSKDLQLDTNGTPLAEDGSFEECVETDAIFFLPSGDQGFIGFHIIGYKPDPDTSSRCQIYLKTLSKIAHDTQLLTPQAGWRYVCNDQRSGSINADWDQDGNGENAYDEGNFTWGTAWKAYFSQATTKMVAATGHNTVFGWSQASSHLQKRTTGLPSPHGQTKSADFLQQEEHQRDFVFLPNHKNDAHGYDCSNTKVERGFRSTHFLMTSIRDNPGGWASDKPRGPMIEWACWGEDFSDLNELDASYLRFGLACLKLSTSASIINHETVEDLTPPMTSQLESATAKATPVAIEEYFLDLDTNWTTPDPIGTYDPGAGATGSKGHPEGLWTWATPDAGERIYIRRLGNWLCILNADDAPSGYDDYAPSHLPGGYTPRNILDEVTPDNFAQLYTDGVLKSGETLRHFDPITYVNHAATSELLSRSSSVWTGFQFGPNQDHPADGTHVLKTVEWMARDRVKNDGSVVDTNDSYFLGPLEAVFLEIEGGS